MLLIVARLFSQQDFVYYNPANNLALLQRHRHETDQLGTLSKRAVLGKQERLVPRLETEEHEQSVDSVVAESIVLSSDDPPSLPGRSHQRNSKGQLIVRHWRVTRLGEMRRQLSVKLR